VRIAAGEQLTAAQDDIAVTGHAVEARVYAEDPALGFLPTGGRVLAYREPKGVGVRTDSGVAAGTVVGSDYDPLLAKVIVHGSDRDSALRGLDRALAATAVLGVVTNIEFLRFLLVDPDVKAGLLDTRLLDRRVGDFMPRGAGDAEFVAAAAYRWLRLWRAGETGGTADLWSVPSGWRMGAPAATVIRLRSEERSSHVHITGSPDSARASVEHGETHTLAAALDGDTMTITLDGRRSSYLVADAEHRIWLAGSAGVTVVDEVREEPIRPDELLSGDAELVSPMPGAIVAVDVTDGAEVTAGTVVVAVEAMKMEHSLSAPVDGVVELVVAVGDQVKVGQVLARIKANEKEASDG
jgi:acetyl-CoA/propionyl-CoA carboxylase biotin carboxyl carrier protein